MAKRNTTEDVRTISLTKLAVKLEYNAVALKEYLDAPEHFAIQNVNVKGKGSVQREVRRNTTVQASVPEDLFCVEVRKAYEIGPAGDDVASGAMARVTRAPLFVHYMGSTWESVQEWEDQREAAISLARSERMSEQAKSLGISLGELKAQVSVLQSLKADKSFLAALAKSNPDMYAILMGDGDTES